jgi:hypothetical protein
MCFNLPTQQGLHVSFLKFDTEPCGRSLVPSLDTASIGQLGRRGHPVTSSPYDLPPPVFIGSERRGASPSDGVVFPARLQPHGTRPMALPRPWLGLRLLDG